MTILDTWVKFLNQKKIDVIYCPFYAILGLFTPFLRQQPCSNESTLIKHTIWGTCKKNFNVVAQTV
jgi:hypothetical protein